jgi:hypothetical protein
VRADSEFQSNDGGDIEHTFPDYDQREYGGGDTPGLQRGFFDSNGPFDQSYGYGQESDVTKAG